MVVSIGNIAVPGGINSGFVRSWTTKNKVIHIKWNISPLGRVALGESTVFITLRINHKTGNHIEMDREPSLCRT